MGEKGCGGHLDWGFVWGYIPVNAQGAHWDCRCIPVNAQGDQWDCGCIPVRASERTGSPVGFYCLWRWTRSPAGLRLCMCVCVRGIYADLAAGSFVYILYSIFYILYSIFYILHYRFFIFESWLVNTSSVLGCLGTSVAPPRKNQCLWSPLHFCLYPLLYVTCKPFPKIFNQFGLCQVLIFSIYYTCTSRLWLYFFHWQDSPSVRWQPYTSSSICRQDICPNCARKKSFRHRDSTTCCVYCTCSFYMWLISPALNSHLQHKMVFSLVVIYGESRRKFSMLTAN